MGLDGSGATMKQGDKRSSSQGERRATPARANQPAQRPAAEREVASPRHATKGQDQRGGVGYDAAAAMAKPPSRQDLAPVPRMPESAIREAADRLNAQHGQQIQASGVPEVAAAAVILTESQLVPAAVDDRMPIRFEPYAFFERTGRWLVATHKDQAAEYKALGEARSIDDDAALRSTRMGLAQVSGAEAEQAGHASPVDMLKALQASPQAQVQALLDVIARDDGLRGAMEAQDWRQVASLRAGPGYGALGYDDALAAYADAYRRSQEQSRGVKPGGDDDDDKPKKPRKPRA